MPKAKKRTHTRKQKVRRESETKRDQVKQSPEMPITGRSRNTGPAVKGQRFKSQPRSVAKSSNRY